MHIHTANSCKQLSSFTFTPKHPPGNQLRSAFLSLVCAAKHVTGLPAKRKAARFALHQLMKLTIPLSTHKERPTSPQMCHPPPFSHKPASPGNGVGNLYICLGRRAGGVLRLDWLTRCPLGLAGADRLLTLLHANSAPATSYTPGFAEESQNGTWVHGSQSWLAPLGPMLQVHMRVRACVCVPRLCPVTAC
jgi:hypothetical protein